MGKSSKDKRDIYYRLAKENGYRARSAYKLKQLDDLYGLLNDDVLRVIDLCAAPGSWSQVVSQHFTALSDAGADHTQQEKRRLLVSIDLQPMAPLPRTIQLQADLTDPETARRVLVHLGQEKADLVICDGAPDVTGLHDLDTYLHHQLFQACFRVVRRTLRLHGTFVAKMFRGGDEELVEEMCRRYFNNVSWHKPLASRASSMEVFLVCQDFRGAEEEEAGIPAAEDRFMMCGDLSSFNSK